MMSTASPAVTDVSVCSRISSFHWSTTSRLVRDRLINSRRASNRSIDNLAGSGRRPATREDRTQGQSVLSTSSSSRKMCFSSRNRWPVRPSAWGWWWRPQWFMCHATAVSGYQDQQINPQPTRHLVSGPRKDRSARNVGMYDAIQSFIAKSIRGVLLISSK